MASNISRSDLIEDLRRVANKIGETPSRRQYEQHGTHGSTTVKNEFGNWNPALREAGLGINVVGEVSRDELLNDIQEVADDLGETPPQRKYSEAGTYSLGAVTNEFENWNTALREAGLDINRNVRNVSRQELIEDLRRVADDLGKTPSIREYRRSGVHSRTAIENEFGTWTNGVREAGLPVVHPGQIPDEDLVSDLQQVAAEIGKSPTCREYAKHGNHSPSAVMNAFGRWNSGLKEAGLEIHSGKDINPIAILKDIVSCSNNGVAPAYHKYAKEVGEYPGMAVLNEFGTWWQAVVQAGVKPASRRPLRPKSSHRFFNTINDLAPTPRFPLLLLMFTGMDRQTIVQLEYDWFQHKRDENIVRVPTKHTSGDMPWLFRLPETWLDPYTEERRQTMLPETAEWVFDNCGEVQYNTPTNIASKALKAAKSAGLEDREVREFATVGEAPVVRPLDLTISHAVNLARQGIETEAIERRVGADGYRSPFANAAEDVMLWLYVNERIVHDEFSPPVVLDPDTGEPRRIDSEPSESV